MKLSSETQKSWTPFQYVFWSVCAQPTHKMKMQIRHALSHRGIDGGAETKKRWLMTTRWTTHVETRTEHSSTPKYVRMIRIPGHIITGTIPSGNTASCRGNKRWPQQASTAKTRGCHKSDSFFAVPPLLPIGIENQPHCCSLRLAEALWVVVAAKDLKHNSTTASSTERQAASPTANNLFARLSA